MFRHFQRSPGLLWPLVLLAAAITLPAMLADDRSRSLAANTLLLSGSVALVSLLLGAPLAFLLVRTDLAGRRVLVVLLLGLLFTPLYVQAAAWQAGFGMQGWFTAWTGGAPLLSGWRGAIAIHSLAAIPWVVLIVGVGLLLAEPELEEEALLDAAPGRVFRRVTLRRAANALGAAGFGVALTTAGEMTVTDLFLVRTFSEQLYTEFALGDVLGAAPWRVVPSLIATVWAVAAGGWLVTQLAPGDRHVTWRSSRVFRLGSGRTLWSVCAALYMALLVGVPAGSLVAKSGMIVTRVGTALNRHWSMTQAASMVTGSPRRFGKELLWTLLIAVLAAGAAAAIALLLAFAARRGRAGTALTWLVIAVFLALPGPLIGLGVIALMNRPESPWLLYLYDHSIAAIWLVQTVRALPVCTLVMWYAVRALPIDLFNSASLDGAGAVSQLLRIVLPQCWRAWGAAWLAGLAIAWGELPASILVTPPGVVTLPIQIFNLIHYGVDDQVAGISLAVWLAFFGFSLVFAACVRAARRSA